LFACAISALSGQAQAFDLQGHRGARGLFPENTLAGFKATMQLGVTTLETDLAVTSDGVVVISHDPALNLDLTRTADGKWLPQTGPAIQSLTRDELRQYDIGRVNPDSRYGKQWPEQKPVDGERFPTLADLFALGGTKVRYNIEIKIDPGKPGLTPQPAAFAALVAAEIRKAGMTRRTQVQSFDWRAVIEMKKQAAEIETACLSIEGPNFDTVRRAGGGPSPWMGGINLADHGGSLPRAVKAAGCSTWSPFWRNATAEQVAEAQTLGLKVIPWTVNDPAEMGRLIDLKVDGLITDYPNRALQVLKAKGMKLQ
jgi:glycerophosphoryl diester phosphodiesterase